MSYKKCLLAKNRLLYDSRRQYVTEKCLTLWFADAFQSVAKA